MDIINLNSFLDFGYFLNYKNENYPNLFDLATIDRGKYENYKIDELVSIGGQIYQSSIDSLFNPNKKQCIPLSGGLDSRGILGALLECTSAQNIYTFTFGIPGAYDYEIGNMIAKKFGTKHKCINLLNYQYTQHELEEVSRRVDMQTVLFFTYPISITDEIMNDKDVWSGAFIDTIFGGNFYKYDKHIDNSFIEAAYNSFEDNKFVPNLKLSNISKDLYLKYIDYNQELEKYFNKGFIIDILNRQVKYLIPHLYMKPFNYKKIIYSKELINFAMSVNQEYHKNRLLYIKILSSLYPNLFNLPIANNYGLPINAPKWKIEIRHGLAYIRKKVCKISKYTKYNNFDKEIRYNDSLKRIIENNIKDLASRKIIDWIDINDIFKRHINKKGNYAKALLVLTSLEIHLKNGKII